MGILDKIKEPIFLKEDSDSELNLSTLKEIAQNAAGELADKLAQEIKLVEAGIYGENTIKYELRNCHIPMFVLHDLYFEYKDLSAQIDFLIITRKHVFVIECKNLYGDIEITRSGDFVRKMSFGRFTRKEGIYSPITQNRRHLELIKQIRRAEKGNMLTKALFDRAFENNYRSIVVLANPKTILNDRYAKKEIKNQVIRADQLSDYIRKVDSDPNAVSSSEKDIETLARFFLGIHKSKRFDYTVKFRELLDTDEKNQDRIISNKPNEQVICPKCGAVMVLRKAARGANAGKAFYGCSKFPKCRGIIAIED